MRLIEPILFPITVYPLEIFKFAGKHNIQNFDIVPNFGYQSHQLILVDKYIDSNLQEKFINVLSNIPIVGFHTTESFVHFVDNHIRRAVTVYELYYRYFLTKYILESNAYEHTVEDLIDWLDEDRDYTFKKCSKYNKNMLINNFYNTVVIPRLWDKVQLENVTWVNKMNPVLPISFTQSKVIKAAGDHLFGGGSIYVLREEDYGKVFWSLGDDFDLKMNEDPWSIIKKDTPKKTKTTNEINWL